MPSLLSAHFLTLFILRLPLEGNSSTSNLPSGKLKGKEKEAPDLLAWLCSDLLLQ
jgi:hypothetical protein